jgi:hypothetical protein
MVRPSAFIILIVLLVLAVANTLQAATESEYGLHLVSWNENNKADVNNEEKKFKTQITGLEFNYFLNKEDIESKIYYYASLGYSKANAESHGDFIFKQTNLSVYSLGGGMTLFMPSSKKVRFGLNTGLSDRVILFNDDAGLSVYDREKILIYAGADIIFPLTAKMQLSQRFSIFFEGKARWSIGFVF